MSDNELNKLMYQNGKGAGQSPWWHPDMLSQLKAPPPAPLTKLEPLPSEKPSSSASAKGDSSGVKVVYAYTNPLTDNVAVQLVVTVTAVELANAFDPDAMVRAKCMEAYWSLYETLKAKVLLPKGLAKTQGALKNQVDLAYKDSSMSTISTRNYDWAPEPFAAVPPAPLTLVKQLEDEG